MLANHKLLAFVALLGVFLAVVILAAAIAHDELTLRLLDGAVVGLVGVIGGAGQAIFRTAPAEPAPPRSEATAATPAPVPERPSWQA